MVCATEQLSHSCSCQHVIVHDQQASRRFRRQSCHDIFTRRSTSACCHPLAGPGLSQPPGGYSKLASAARAGIPPGGGPTANSFLRPVSSRPSDVLRSILPSAGSSRATLAQQSGHAYIGLAEARPSSIARTAACVRSDTSSLRITCSTCVLTVLMVKLSVSAISRFVWPSTINRSTSCSRLVNCVVIC